MQNKALDHERLDVYQVSLEFITLMHEMMGRLPRGHASLADQLERAATSIVLNIAEGSGEFGPKEKIRFYRIALRSTMECAAIMDVGHLMAAIPREDATRGKRILTRIGAMLIALVHRHDAP